MTNKFYLSALVIFWLLAGLLLPGLGLTSLAQSPHHRPPSSGYLPQRVFDAKQKEFTDLETLLSEAARADVLFVGEQHDDPATHRLQLALLEGIARRRSNVVLALEMFERDVQPVLDDYLAGRASLDEFIVKSRPWRNFATDYHPLVAFAKARGWRVVASNIPRPYASRVAREGLSSLEQLSAADRQHAARQIECPNDDYRKRVVAAINGHPTAKADRKQSEAERAAAAARNDRFYFAQCIKDETMAESVEQALTAAPGARPLVIHLNGAFHSDYHAGIVPRLKRRLPDVRVKAVSIIPVDNLDLVDGRAERKRADYLAFVLKPQAKPAGDQAAEPAKSNE